MANIQEEEPPIVIDPGDEDVQETRQEEENEDDDEIVEDTTEEYLFPDSEIVIDATDDIKLFRLSKFPELQVGQKEKCKKVFGKKICWGEPYARTRQCTIDVYARVTYPTIDDIMDDIKECLPVAAAVAVAAYLNSGSLSVTHTAFTESLKQCLIIKGVDNANKVEVGIGKRKQCGRWK